MNNEYVKKSRFYMCIEDWHRDGSAFTKGKVYKCHKDRCMYDDFGAEKTCVEKLFRLATKEEIKAVINKTKKYQVTFYFHTSLTVEVEAENEQKALENARVEADKECYIKDLLNGLQDDGDPDVEELNK